MSLEALLQTLDACIIAQSHAVRDWHSEEPLDEPLCVEGDLISYVLAQHQRNFQLWHVEDIARRTDIGTDVIADCKRKIDGLNQQRNDAMEHIDDCLLKLLVPLLPAKSTNRINTEPPGMVIDRLSILNLKIWHMREQVERDGVSQEHVVQCKGKLDVLTNQHAELVQALKELIVDYVEGNKRPARYFQCKMYNDPSLNPQLYTKS